MTCLQMVCGRHLSEGATREGSMLGHPGGVKVLDLRFCTLYGAREVDVGTVHPCPGWRGESVSSVSNSTSLRSVSIAFIKNGLQPECNQTGPWENYVLGLKDERCLCWVFLRKLCPLLPTSQFPPVRKHRSGLAYCGSC